MYQELALLPMKNLKNTFAYNLIILTLVFLAIISHIRYLKNPSIYKNGEIQDTFLVKNFKISGNQLNMTIYNKENVQAFYYFSTEKEQQAFLQELQIGDIISIKGTISTPNTNQLPNTFNYQEYLLGNNIKKIITISQLNNTFQKRSSFFKFQNKLLKKNNNLTSAYINALIFANKLSLENEVIKSYQLNGISHLLAISGMHISLLCHLITKGLKKLPFLNPNIIMIFFLTFYISITNFSPSIIRASIFYLAMQTKFLKFNSHQITTIIILFLLIIFPYYFYNLSFKYSAITCFFLTKIKQSSTSFLKANIITSIIAFLASLPITINSFFEVNLLSPILNLFFVPLVSYIIYPLIVTTYIIPFIQPITEVFLHLFENLSLLMSNISFLIISFPKIKELTFLIYYIMLFLALSKSLKYFLIILVLLIINKYSFYIDPNSYLYFLNVGQGDSALIITPYHREIILIDTGGKIPYSQESWQLKDNNISLAQNIITFLKSIGITKINTMILTHGDYDHIGEAKEIIENFSVHKVIFNKGQYNELEQELIVLLKNQQISYTQSISNISGKNFKLQFLNRKIYDNENDNSIIVHLQLGQITTLFMGDASKKVEKDLLKIFELKIPTILKVGHHGSSTSTSQKFINQIKPQYSIISVGANNRYGHPQNEVLSVLKNSTIYRTDINGNIIFKINNNIKNIILTSQFSN